MPERPGRFRGALRSGAITLGVLGDISNYLQEKSPKAVVRLGDYPRGGKEISVTVILSQLTAAARMENLFF